jgi:hypothetical protein
MEVRQEKILPSPCNPGYVLLRRCFQEKAVQESQNGLD